MIENNYFSLNDIMDRAKLSKIDNIYIFSHTRHDGDAKGASLALSEFFRNKGFNSKYIITEEDRCLINILGRLNKTNLEEDEFIAVSLDTSTEEGSDNTLYKNAISVYKIDHHRNSEPFGDYNYIDEEASATCEIISSMIDESDITSTIATYLYTGIYTDTGGLKRDFTDKTFMQLAKLCRCGAKYDFVVNNFKYISSSRKRIEGIVSSRHKFFTKDVVGTIIYKENNRDFDALSVAKAVNTLTSLKAKVFFCCCESEDGNVFFEIRSSQDSNIDVSTFAQNYGGGGHFHSVSFVVSNLSETKKIIAKICGLH